MSSKKQSQKNPTSSYAIIVTIPEPHEKILMWMFTEDLQFCNE